MIQSGVVWMYFMLVHIMYTVMHKMNLSSWQSEADILNCKEPCSNQLIQVIMLLAQHFTKIGIQ